METEPKPTVKVAGLWYRWKKSSMCSYKNNKVTPDFLFLKKDLMSFFFTAEEIPDCLHSNCHYLSTRERFRSRRKIRGCNSLIWNNRCATILLHSWYYDDKINLTSMAFLYRETFVLLAFSMRTSYYNGTDKVKAVMPLSDFPCMQIRWNELVRCTFFLCSFWRSLNCSILFTSSFSNPESCMCKFPTFSISNKAGRTTK